MDLNQPFEFNPSSTSFSQMQNSVPMSSFMLPLNHPLKEVNEELSRSQLLIQKRNIELFWQQQMAEMRNTTAFRGQQQLPLARVKKIMRSDQDVKMISAETPALFSKACEIFIQELTLRAWMQTEQCRRRTLQRCDVALAIRQKETMDFLIDMVPLNHPKDHHGNFPQPSEFQPGNQMQFPMLDMNAQLNPEVEQQLMTQPPMPFGDFDMGVPQSE